MIRKLNEALHCITIWSDILDAVELNIRKRKTNKRKFKLNKDGRKKETELPKNLQKILDSFK